jgi:hypothetical protein
MPTSKSKLYHISPAPLISRDSDEGTDQTSMVEPHDDELSNSGWTEVPDREWSDEQLLDDARPGRRKGVSETTGCESGQGGCVKKGGKRYCSFM